MQKTKKAESLMALTHTHTHTQVSLENNKENNINKTRLNL